MKTHTTAVHVALLRAVNLGAHNKVAMRDLCELLTGLGMHGARSLLQSGNLVFGSGVRTTGQLEHMLEQSAKERLGLETEFFVRTAGEWDAIVAGNPFTAEAERDPSHLLVILLKEVPDAAAVTALRKAIAGREAVRAAARHAYVVYPDGIGRSRLTTALIEKTLGTRVTGRNWNTVVKLSALTKL